MQVFQELFLGRPLSIYNVCDSFKGQEGHAVQVCDLAAYHSIVRTFTIMTHTGKP